MRGESPQSIANNINNRTHPCPLVKVGYIDWMPEAILLTYLPRGCV